MNWEEPIHRSLHRPPLVLGGDRELVMFSALGAFLVGLGGFTLFSALCGFLFWLASLHWLRKWGKIDPLMCRVYFQSLKYRKKYLAGKSVWCTPSPAMAKHWRQKRA